MKIVCTPATPETYDDWTRTIRRVALARKVLCVATTRVEGSWTAYINAVPGLDHHVEVDVVLARGTKLPERIARMLFPEFDGQYDR